MRRPVRSKGVNKHRHNPAAYGSRRPRAPDVACAGPAWGIADRWPHKGAGAPLGALCGTQRPTAARQHARSMCDMYVCARNLYLESIQLRHALPLRTVACPHTQTRCTSLMRRSPKPVAIMGTCSQAARRLPPGRNPHNLFPAQDAQPLPGRSWPQLGADGAPAAGRAAADAAAGRRPRGSRLGRCLRADVRQRA